MTPDQKAKAKIERHAITALKQRFSGMTPRQREAIKTAANAMTEQEFGRTVWLAVSKSQKYINAISRPF